MPIRRITKAELRANPSLLFKYEYQHMSDKQRKRLGYAKRPLPKEYKLPDKETKYLNEREYYKTRIPKIKHYQRKIYYKGNKYHSIVLIHFKWLNYYNVQSKGDKPEIEDKFYTISFKYKHSQSFINNRINGIVNSLRSKVEYKRKNKEYLRDSLGKKIPSKLKFYKVVAIKHEHITK